MTGKTYFYTGKAIKPRFTVYDRAGKKVGKKKNIPKYKATVKITLKKGKTAKIKAEEVKKGGKIKRRRKLRYESSNPNVATVSKKGKIKARGKGTCYIRVYSQSGAYKSVKVKVK